MGTTINRGEDLAVKGAVSVIFWDNGLLPLVYNVNLQTYIFEVVEVVPDPNSKSKRWYKLRLDCRDDAKGPVTAVCGMNGYLVSSMGQKVWGTATSARVPELSLYLSRSSCERLTRMNAWSALRSWTLACMSQRSEL